MNRDPERYFESRSLNVIADFRPPEYSDEALALEFADRHNFHLRYVAKWSRWLAFDGNRWREDSTLGIYDLCRTLCRERAARCTEKEHVRRGICSSKTVAAVVTLARCDRRIAATVDQWDSDSWMLNMPDTILDLKTGRRRAASPADYCTKQTMVSAKGECPLWDAFLKRVTNDDADLAAFLKRVCGYCLTGSTKEHALFFLHGTGANGKSVFIDTVAGILGDYHRTAPIETFTASPNDRHPTDIASLLGARLVTAVETEEGRRWDESKIKGLTGGDMIAARFMRQDFFEYKPQFKLMIGGNHKPGLRSVDEAIRRRFHLVPFSVTIPQQERELELAAKLRAEWPGILAWMIEGCLEWQKQGLAPPAVVTEATAAYLEGEDSLSAWLDECTVKSASSFTTRRELYASLRRWAEANGEYVIPNKRFVAALEVRGYVPEKRSIGRGFVGLRLVGDT